MEKLEPKLIQNIIALTPLQEGILFHYLKDPDSHLYFVQLSLEISGKIDAQRFEYAWNRVVQNNEILRTLFRWEKIDKPTQNILKEHIVKPGYYDLSGIQPGRKKILLQELKNKDWDNKFDLHDVSFRITLCKIEEDSYEMIVSNHHILYDGWSNGIILKEFFEAYNETTETGVSRKPAKTPFKKYVKWIQSQDIRKQDEYWREYLKGLHSCTRLPIKGRKIEETARVPGYVSSCWPMELKENLDRFIKTHKITLASLLYGAWGLLLNAYNNSNDAVFGATTSGRSAKIKGIEEMVGLFINTLPLRVQTFEHETVKNFLQRLDNNMQSREVYEAIPLVHIRTLCDNILDRNEELFDTIVVLENYPLNLEFQPDALITPGVYHMVEMTHYDLTVGITVFDHIEISFIYDQELLEEDTVSRLAGHFKNIMAVVISDPHREAAGIEMLSEEEKKQVLLDFNQTSMGEAGDFPVNKTIHELFEEQASRIPDHFAVFGHGLTQTNTDNNMTITYRELNEQANRVAWLLIEKGILADSIVGIMMKRSMEMITGILGILKAGGAYLPINPDYPDERIDYMLKDSGAKILVNEKFFGGPYRRGDFSKKPPGIINLAYIIYTSGSTGIPKGVPITHANLCPLLHWGYESMGWGPGDHVIQTLAYYFDWSAWEIFMAITSGASLYMISEELLLNPGAQLDFIRRNDITVMETTPTRFQSLVASGPKPGALDTLRCLCIGAEKLTVSLVKSARELIAGDCRVFNLYGPTEATIISAAMEIDMGALEKYEYLSGIPIGRTVGNGPLLVLDKYLNLCPVNVVGELYITGDGIAGGYLNNPELTAEKFILPSATRNPFEKGFLDLPKLLFIHHSPFTTHHLPIYKTGDLVRWLPNGNIEYLGRIDQQVKIRGFRIELGEIENCLLSHKNIKEAIVLQEKDATGEPCLQAYIVYAGTGDSDSENSTQLRHYLSRLLPAYMIPSHFHKVDHIPLTSNGKIDRRALASTGKILKSGVEYITPQSDIEKTIAQVWREILGVENVGIHDHFFDRGGNSLSIIRLSSHLSQALQTDIPVVTIFNHPTIAALAGHLLRLAKKETSAGVETLQKTETGEIAVIGMAGRFPCAKNIEQFWENLKNGVEAITFFSREELKEMDVNPEWLNNPEYLYVPAKGVLPGHDYFDAFFFGYTPVEAGIMDPQVRVFHECVYEALENAAYDPGSYPGAIGLFAGASPNPFWEVLPLRSGGGAKDYPGLWNAIQFSDKDYLSTRIAYKLDLRGPCVTLQTACSTSLTAVDQACRSLLNRVCDMALAGGVSITLHDQAGYLYQEGTIMSPDGHCRAFDAQARGTVGGNGVGVVVLKRLQEAMTDGDQILAVIKGLGITNDGKNKVGFTAPSSDGQAAAICAAMNMAEVSPESIGYIEAHGTGTPLGDPIEIEGLKKAFNRGNPFATKQKKYCAIGSVKTNIGHLDAAAGIAGLIKTVLALHHRMLPPSLYFERPNPSIDFENSPFYVNTQLLPWHSSKYPLRAGVSSFGLGGTNVHLVLEETPPNLHPPVKNGRPYQLLVLSAKTGPAMEQITQNLTEYFKRVATEPEPGLADAAYTLQVGRKAFKYRRMLVCTDLSDAVRRMTAGEMENGFAKAEKLSVIFMFSGQGSQYVNMGLNLYRQEPVFRDLIDQCFAMLEKITNLDMKSVLYPATNQVEQAEERIYQFLYTTPIKFIFEYALARLLISWGIRPDAMIGHSFGEYVAACLAGVFSLEDGLYLAALRGETMHSLPEGAMLSVPLSETELTPLLNEQLSLATLDAPSLSVVSGPVDAIEAFAKQLNEMGHECIRFRVPRAGHSWMVEPIQADFKKKIAGKTFNKPTIPYISGMSGKWITAAEAMDPDYWVRHLRAPVRFADGLTTLFKEPNPVFLQVGPGKGLTMFVNRHPAMTPDIPTFNMLRHPKEETTDVCYMLAQVGRLWMLGVEIDWPTFHAGENRRRIPLPTYPFAGDFYPVDKNLFKLDVPTPAAATLKKNPDISAWFYIPSWQRTIVCNRGPRVVEEKNSPSAGNGPTLILMDRSGVGLRLQKELEARGREVFVFDDCLDAGAYDDFIRELARRDKFPYRVYHLTGIDPIDSSGGARKQVDDALARGFYNLLFLVQALGKHEVDPQREIQLEVVTGSGQEVTGEEELSPGKAPVYGLCQVIPQEYPSIRCRCSDILQTQKGEWLTPLIEDLCVGFADGAERMVAYRGNYRWVKSYKPQRLEKPEPAALPLRTGGVYLITGGVGSIGLILARHLAASYKAKLALTCRSEFPDASEWGHWLEIHTEEDRVSRKIRKLMEIEALGGRVMIMPADVASVGAMRDVLHRVEDTFGPINGLIHSAGIVGRQSFTALADMGKAEAQMHFESKIYGLQVLTEVLKDVHPDFCLVMSSTAAVLGGLGFGAYSAANAFMDSYIHQLNKIHDTRWFSINWDGWQLDDQKFQDSPLGAVIKDLAMTPGEGTEVMERVLAGVGLQQVVQCTGDLQLRIDRWLKLSNAVQLQQESQDDLTTARATTFQARPARPHLDTPYEAPANPVEEALTKIWLDLLGYDLIGSKDNFFVLNGDSLKAVIAVSAIHQQLGIKVPLTEFFALPTISDLARYISARQKPTATTTAEQVQMPEHQYIAIPPIEKREYCPLSSAQKRMYILNRMDQAATAYNITTVMEMRGALDEEKFRGIFNRIIQRHESLRTSFLVINEEPIQRIHDIVEFAVEYIKYPPAGVDDAETQKKQAISAFIRPFDLSQAPLLRIGLVKEDQFTYLLIVDMHHIISDGTSMGVLVKEFIQLFQGETLAPLPIQYKDYACMRSDERNMERWERQAAYWRRELSGVLPVLNLPTDFPRPAVWDFAGRQSRFILAAAETAALKALARTEDVTLYMVLLSIYTILLANLAGQEEILVGAPIAGRSHADLQQVIGMFINTLGLRCFPMMEDSYRNFLLELKTVVLAALENQDYPFEDVVEQIALSREVGRNPLFDVAFVLQNMDIPEIEIPGLKLIPYIFDSAAAKLDVALIAEDLDDSLCFTFEYRTSLFTPETMERFIGYFKQIAAAIVDDSRQRLSDIDIISQAEKLRLLDEFNRSETVVPGNSTLQQLFQEQVVRTPAHIAVFGHRRTRTNTDNNIFISYRELNERSDKLAGLLIEKGVLADNIVSIIMERSIDLIIGILGILKAGGVYMSIDPGYPQERIAYMLKDSGTKILINKSEIRNPKSETNTNDQNKNRNFGIPFVLNFEHLNFDIVSCFEFRASDFNSSNLAYVIYTSGTTGRPRGVLVRHSGVVNLVFSHWLVFGENSRSRISQVSSVSFDAMVSEVWPCLLSGGSLCICDNETRMSPRLLKEWLIRHQITHSYQPTAMAMALLEEEWPEDSPLSLEVLRTGGDRLASYPPRCYPFRFFNLYGPTEDSVWTTWCEVPAPPTPSERVQLPSIGRPVPNHYVYILGPRNDLRPIGSAGELCITGIGLAAGYLNKPELTAEKFILPSATRGSFEKPPLDPTKLLFNYYSPLTTHHSPLYHTGDLARWLPDGNIEYLGRIDHQVKIRGFRIELGEIEFCLTAMDNVTEAVVIDREDPQGEKYLCAYIVCRQEPDTVAIIKALSPVLPHYMIPAYFVPLPGIPLTPNGKVDRRALPAPEFKTSDDCTTPTTLLQNTLAEIWSGILAIPKDKISIHSNFFQLGGHSLKAAMVMEKIHKELQVTVPLNKIFEIPTIDALASFINLILLKENLTRPTITAAGVDPIREEIIL